MRVSTGPRASATPIWMTLSVELAGGTLSWDLEDTADNACLDLWSPVDADWLWRIVGESTHVRVLGEIDSGTTDLTIELVTGPDQLHLLRRLAWGHWLRRWWPTSTVNGLDALSSIVLDVEVALLTAECDAYFDAESFDGAPESLLAPHGADEISSLATHFSADVRALHRRWLAYDADASLPIGPDSPARADDYALAAGPTSISPRPGGIADGRASIAWESVPANVFDAAENTVTWSIDSVPDVVADVAVRLLPGRDCGPTTVELRLPDPPITARGRLDAAGTTRITLPLTAAQAWQTDWSALECRIGGTAGGDAVDDDAPRLRDRVRALIQRRISGTEDGTPLFVAEQLIADADY